MEEGLGKAQGSSILYRPAKDSAKNIIAVIISRKDAICDGETQGTQVICNNPKGDIDLFLFIFWLSIFRKSRGETFPDKSSIFEKMGEKTSVS